MKQPEILLIDDEPIVGQRLKGTLEKLGCSVEVLENPVSALTRIKEKTFDIIITDVMMPEVNGFQILEKAREITPNARIIIITGFATIDMARDTMEKGAFDMIAKPFKPSDLRRVVIRAAHELGFTNISEKTA